MVPLLYEKAKGILGIQSHHKLAYPPSQIFHLMICSIIKILANLLYMLTYLCVVQKLQQQFKSILLWKTLSCLYLQACSITLSLSQYILIVTRLVVVV
jgi:hypothetical protein